VTTWQVAWTATASRSLTVLPEKVATAAIEFVYGPLVDNPQRVGKPLRFELEGLHVARRGDYRVIYEIDDGVERIVVHVIEHRANAYRRR
jgi:mRNA interferase RelE/StbE